MRATPHAWRPERSVCFVEWLRFGLFGIEQRDLYSNTPVGCAGRMQGVAVEVYCDIDGLIAETHDTSGAAAKGYRPHAPGGGVVPIGGFAGGLAVPVRGDDWRGGEIPTLVQVVVDEVLEQHLIHIWPVCGPGDGEDVVDQGSDGPMAGLDQRDCRWAKAQLALTESGTGGGGDDDCRPQAPD